MPQLARITSTFFTDLITRLGIRPPFDQGFEMSNVVTPVSLVDSGIVLNASVSTMTLSTPYTNGDLSSPADLVVWADTGALAAGTYAVYITCGRYNDGGSAGYRIQRRNAANSASLWQTADVLRAGTGEEVRNFTCRIESGERIRVQGYGAASTVVISNIWVQLIAG